MTLTDRETGVMIPKKLHYCWLSGDPFPPLVQHCMESWKKHFSDFEFILWDTKRFNTHQIPFTRQACAKKQWAFAADYIRIHALNEQGGIYLDSDVEVLKSFDHFYNHTGFFSCLEYHPDMVSQQLKNKTLYQNDSRGLSGIGIQAAVLGSTPQHPLLQHCMNWYQETPFSQRKLAPGVIAEQAKLFGFRYIDLHQKLEKNIEIYPSYIFAGAPHEANIESFAIHHCAGSWRTP